MAQPIMPTARTSPFKVKFSLTPQSRKRNLLLREHNPYKRGRPRSPNWLDLPEDITASIFSRLRGITILYKCQLVCKTWLKICKGNPLVCRTIDMQCHFMEYHFYGRMENMCRHLIDRSCGSLVDINLVRYCDDVLLKHITDSSACGIRRLRLEDCRKITDEGLCRVASSFTQLKELDISECFCSWKTLEVIGRSSPRLVSLKLMSRRKKERSSISMYGYSIARTMPGLHRLSLSGFELTNHVLRKILDSCRGLETLDLSHSHLPNLADSSTCGIRRLRLEDCRKITDEGLCRVASSFTQLKELDISECFCSWKTLEVIGRSSPRLVSLKLMSLRKKEGSSMYGYSIARTMPGLRSLSLSGFELTNHVLRKILDSCRGLETLDLSHSHLPNLAEDLGRRCVKQITKKLQQLPYGLNYSRYNIEKYLTQANELNEKTMSQP